MSDEAEEEAPPCKWETKDDEGNYVEGAEGATDEECARIVARTPLGRFGHPDDVAAAIMFLLEGSDFVTGTTLAVDGGRALA